MNKKKYTARYTLEHGRWLVEIVEIPQVHSFATTFAKARAHIRDALGLWLHVEDPATLDIADELAGVPGDLADEVSEARRSRAQANQLLARSQELTAEAARRLVKDVGVSTRDAAELLGVSHQRVHQLLQQAHRRSA